MRNVSVEKAAQLVGSKAMLGKLLGVSRQSIHNWSAGLQRVPATYCPAIEELTDGQVTCEELRSDINWSYLRQSHK